MIAHDQPVKVVCTKCWHEQPIDLEALREKVGGSYSLINRRPPCRFTEGCEGRVIFAWLHGVWRPMID